MRESGKHCAQSVLLLDGHCIACAVNRRARELTEGLLTCEDETVKQGLNRELEMLTRFHQQTDFNRLRAKRPELTGSRRVEVTLREKNGKTTVESKPAKASFQEGEIT